MASGTEAAAGTRLLLLADTHVPRRAKDLPPQVWAALEHTDIVVHAGDWVEVSLLDRLEARARRLVGVVGNNDGAALRARLPELAHFEAGDLRWTVVHETGPAGGRARRMAALYPDTDVLVFGHSHIPWDTRTQTVEPPAHELRLLNPGSPTDRRAQPACTFMTVRADAGHLHELTLHLVPPRTAGT